LLQHRVAKALRSIRKSTDASLAEAGCLEAQRQIISVRYQIGERRCAVAVHVRFQLQAETVRDENSGVFGIMHRDREFHDLARLDYLEWWADGDLDCADLDRFDDIQRRAAKAAGSRTDGKTASGRFFGLVAE